MKLPLVLLIVFAIAACKNDQFDGRNYAEIPTSTVFALGQKTGAIRGVFVKELSGMAASHLNPGTYWVHDDGRKVTKIYLIDSLGHQLATLRLPLTTTQDCEDIEVGTDANTGMSYIYLADIGDNKKVFAKHFIYRIPEPILAAGLPNPAELTVDSIEKLTFQYPDDGYYNAETLLRDPATQDLFILTKANGGATLFSFPFPQSSNKTTTLERLGNLPIDRATAGNVSRNGTEILIKNKRIVYYWKGERGTTLADLLLTGRPDKVPYQVEKQGEAVCFNKRAGGFYTSTERAKGLEQAVYWYARK